MDLLLRALALNKDNTLALYILGEYAVKYNHPTLVEISYTSILKSDPANATIMIRLGILYLSKGLLEKASDLFRKAYDIGRDSKPTHDGYLELSLAGLAFIASKQKKNDLKLDFAKKTIALLDEIVQRTKKNTQLRHFGGLQRLIRLSKEIGDEELVSYFEQESKSLQP
jgi:tetratricopeptide (TPR) repeat protein